MVLEAFEEDAGMLIRVVGGWKADVELFWLDGGEALSNETAWTLAHLSEPRVICVCKGVVQGSGPVLQEGDLAFELLVFRA